MFSIARPTLKTIFVSSLAGLTVALGLLFYVFYQGSQRTILQSASQLRQSASHEAADRVMDSLNSAPEAVDKFQRQMHYGITDPRKADSVEAGLLALLIGDDKISEASFTYARSTGFDKDGNLAVAPQSAGEVSVYRTPGSDMIISMRTWWEKGKYVAESHPLPSSAGHPGTAEVPDPTSHLTFQAPASRDARGSLLWTDLHYSQLDDNLPEAQRRVEVSVQKAINDPQGNFAGVIRLGLLKDQIDRAIQVHLSTSDTEKDEHLFFLCDNSGRLIAGPGTNHIIVTGDDLRVAYDDQPKAVIAALHSDTLKNVTGANPLANETFKVDKQPYLVSFRALDGTQDWIVGIVVPRSFYLRDLTRTRNRILAAVLVMIIGILVLGAYILKRVGEAHSLIVQETSRMNSFQFAPSPSRSRLGDVNDVLEGLERAKTAMRAMGKYVPLDLVKRLYRDGKEPELGGETVELSILFSDIKDFTTYAEQIEPHRLAEVLGLYLQTITRQIQKEKGTIDKYIGDAVMAFWNAPEEVRYHPLLACHAAINSRRALKDLFASKAWKGLPPFETRFGIHRDEVSVGHFGSPDRFNYTAIGDGVNLASRLEGLNKVYGTCILVSETVHESTHDHFEYRKLDRVSVKGKTNGVVVYELLGEKVPEPERPAYVSQYEDALEAYLKGNFSAALERFEHLSEDAASVLMAERCREFLAHPPAAWDGTFVAQTK
jgi:adenylate cyclase